MGASGSPARSSPERGTYQAAGTQNSDPSVADRFVAAESTQPGPDTQHAADAQTLEWYGDPAYGTGHLAVLKPKPLQPAVAGWVHRRRLHRRPRWRHGDLPQRHTHARGAKGRIDLVSLCHRHVPPDES
jgi:hypothetical protein